MKKFILDILLFIISAVIVYSVIIVAWKEFGPKEHTKNIPHYIKSSGFTYTRMQEVKKTNDIDLLILGSSHAYRNFNTSFFDRLNLSSFNLGSSSQTHIQTNLLLNRYLHLLNPKIALYEVYPFTMTADGVESSLDLIANDANDLQSLKMAINTRNIKVVNSFIYSVYNQYFQEKEDEELVKKSGDKYIQGGFVESKEKEYSATKYEEQEWHYLDQQINYFKKNVSLLKENGVEVIFIYAPITRNRYNSYTNHDEFFELIKKQGDFINFNDLSIWEDSLHFNDSHHLNSKGREVFNSILVDSLKRRKMK